MVASILGIAKRHVYLRHHAASINEPSVRGITKNYPSMAGHELKFNV